MKHTKDLNTISEELREFLVSIDDFEFGQKIGEGGFGEVFICVHRPTGKTCAVKKLFAKEPRPRDIMDFTREVEVLAKCDNMFLLPFYGFTQTVPLIIATEYIPNGSLFNALRHRKGSPELTGTHKTIIALGIAHGMAALHAKGIIHRDLKSLNVLLDNNLLPKVCDFGVSKIVTEETTAMTRDVGTPHWMAPELFGSTNYTNKVDVYAYGILLWEMLTETGPFKGKDGYQIALAVCTKKERPLIPQNTPRDLKKFINMCWHQEPAKRPSFEKIITILESRKVTFPHTDKSAFDLLKAQITSDTHTKRKNAHKSRAILRKDDIAALSNAISPLIGNHKNADKHSDHNSNKSDNKNDAKIKNELNENDVKKDQEKDSGKHRRHHKNHKHGKTSNSQKNVNTDEPDYSSISHIDDPNYKRNFKACLKNLNEEYAKVFFDELNIAFKSNMCRFVMTQVDRAVRTNVQIFNLFIQYNALYYLPLNDEHLGPSLALVLYSVKQRPDILVKDLLNYLSITISREPGKLLCIIYNALEVFDKLPNGWDVSDFLLKQSVYQEFLNSRMALQFIQVIYFMIITYSQFHDARIQYVFNICICALNSEDTEICHSVYQIIKRYPKQGIDISDEILVKHMQNPKLSNDVVSFLLINDYRCLPPDIFTHITKNADSDSGSSILLVSSCDRPNFIDLVLKTPDNWLADGTLSPKMIAYVLPGIMYYPDKAPYIASLPHFPDALSTLVKSGTTQEMNEVAFQVVFKCVPNAEFARALNDAKFFKHLTKSIKFITNPQILVSAYNCVEYFSKAGFQTFLVKFASILIDAIKDHKDEVPVVYAALSSMVYLYQFQNAAFSAKQHRVESALNSLSDAQFAPLISQVKEILAR